MGAKDQSTMSTQRVAYAFQSQSRHGEDKVFLTCQRGLRLPWRLETAR